MAAASPSSDNSMINIDQTWTTVGSNDQMTTLKGRFYGDDSSHPMLPQIFIPTFKQLENFVTIKWKSMQNPEWWTELHFHLEYPNSAKFTGRNIPDNTLTRFDNEGTCKTFRFDSKSNFEFWAEVTIIEN